MTSPVKSLKTSMTKKRSRDEAGDSSQSSPPSSPRPNPAMEWKKVKLKTEDLLALVNSDKEIDLWRIATGDPYLMEKNSDEISMFARFVERGLALSANDFFNRMLRYYGIEYLNLNPNGIFGEILYLARQLSVF
jgi:hypothetical protein